MCGIAGMLSGRSADPQESPVASMIRTQRRRGPDHQAVTTVARESSTVVFGHCRLMIVDLTPGAHQPLWDHQGRCCLVHNGEIYNHLDLRRELEGLGHRFLTRSDSEVVLEAYKAWGVRAFERFNGMFAFALHDTARRRLFLVRDRFGVKPLYWLLRDDRLWFASTCGAIRAQFPLEPNLAYLSRGIRYWVYDDEDLSPYLGLRAVRPGHSVEAWSDRSGLIRAQETSYYDLARGVADTAETIAGAPERELHERLAHLVESSIDLRLRADVPVGVSLSGGLDSSTVAATAYAKGRVIGFTFGHPLAPATEGPAVSRLARHTGIPIRFIRPEPATIIDAFFESLRAQEAPFPSASIVGQFLVYRAAHEEGVRVVLGGQGSDEIFMGYRKFQLFRLRQLLRQRHLWSAMAFASSVVPEVLAELPRVTPYWRLRDRYLHPVGLGTALELPPPEPMNLLADLERPLWVRQAHDVQHSSLPTLLRYEDRNSMAHGVESRLPYLDYRLVEFALALPVTLKLRHGFRKWIMREFARGRIPEAIRLARHKRGFDVEQGAWIDAGLGAAIRRRLAEREPELRAYLARGARIESVFSDARLKSDASAVAEATALLWLGDQAEGMEGGPASEAPIAEAVG